MRIWKQKPGRNEGGWDIALQVGRMVYWSWWSNPPDSVDHVDLQYLRDRYPVISTERRVSKFKELFKKMQEARS